MGFPRRSRSTGVTPSSLSPRRALILLALLTSAASGQDALKPLEGELDPLIVTGKAENLLG